MSGWGNSAGIQMKLHHVAHAGHAKRVRHHAQSARGQRVAPTLEQRFVVRARMHQTAVDGSLVVLPLLLDEDQRPLPRAEGIVLHA